VASDQEQVEEPPQVGEEAPDFTLQDADDQEHALQKMRGKVVFLIMGNRKIRKEDDKWAHAFQKDYQESDRVVAYIVADMRSVPAFVPKGLVKRQLKKDKPPVMLLLDWKGKVHQAYLTEKEKPNLYIIGPEGKLAFHIKSNFDKETYQELKAVIDGFKN
jgi:peroxiredoxin